MRGPWKTPTAGLITCLAALVSLTAASLAGAGAAAGPTSAQVSPILYGGRVVCPYREGCEGKPRYNGAIYSVPATGGPSRRLTTGRFDDEKPAWSPDRRRIAFVRNVAPGAGYQVWVMNANGTGARRVTRGQVDTEPAWSPDGRWIAYRGGTRRFDIFVVHPDGSGRRNVTRNPAGIGALDPTWSRDGMRIAFQRADSRAAETGVYSIGIDGRGIRRLARDGYAPDWSPDGRRIAYMRYIPLEGFEIYTMGPFGGAKRRITRDERWDWVSPTWSPDSRRIAADRSGRLTVMRADGSVIRSLTVRRPRFTIVGISW